VTVVGVAHAPHRRLDPRLPQALGGADREVLHTPVAVVHKLMRVRSGVQHLIEGIERQVAPWRPRHPPPDDPAGQRVDHERHVHEPRPGSHVGQVRHPQLVGSAGREVALDTISRTR